MDPLETEETEQSVVEILDHDTRHVIGDLLDGDDLEVCVELEDVKMLLSELMFLNELASFVFQDFLNVNIDNSALLSNDKVAINEVDLLVWGSLDDKTTDISAKHTLGTLLSALNSANLVAELSLFLMDLLVVFLVINLLAHGIHTRLCESCVDVDTTKVSVLHLGELLDGVGLSHGDLRLHHLLLGILWDNNAVILVEVTECSLVKFQAFEHYFMELCLLLLVELKEENFVGARVFLPHELVL